MKNYVKAALTAILTAQCTAVMIVKRKEKVWSCREESADFNPKIGGLKVCTNVQLEEVPEWGCYAGLVEADKKCYEVEVKVNGDKFASDFMEQYDSDMDGTITKEELPEKFQRLFDHADADKNGTLSKKEIAAVAVDYVKALTQIIGVDKNGDSEITPDETPGFWSHYKKVDMDKSGSVDVVDQVLFDNRGR